MKRMPLSLTTVAAVICVCAIGAAGTDNLPASPNIIFVMADDMGWGQTGYRGHPLLKTPNLDAMAAHGLRFELYDLEADPQETRDLGAAQPERFQRMKQQLRAWNETVEASFAGKDYPEGRVTPADPEPRFWYDHPAYQAYLPGWKDRWEFKSYIERQRKAGKGGKRKAISP